MGRQHVRDGLISVKQAKTGAALVLPVRPELQAAIDAVSGGHLTFLVKKTGRPYCGSEFSNEFRKWCDEAGLPDCSFHGLRKACCRRLAEAGCSANEIAAWSGHASLSEVARYTKAADRVRLAKLALGRTANAGVKLDVSGVSNPLIGQAKKAGQ
jgi:integrase